MTERTYRRGGRDDRQRGYERQAEQFDPAEQGWRDEERGYGQMGEAWRDDHGQIDAPARSYGQDRDVPRGWGGGRGRHRGGEVDAFGPVSHRPGRYGGEPRGFGSFTGNDFGGRDFTSRRYAPDRGSAASYGAGSRLAANHGEWHSYGASPSREYRDYRGTWGGDDNERGWFERAGDAVASFFGDEDAERRSRMDYRGHGPSGYTRSDERIREDANDRLTDDWGVDARKISVSVSSGDITLDGTVPSRAQKRRAEDCVDDLSGVKNVQNNLRIEEGSAWDRNDRSEFGGSQGNRAAKQA